MSDARGLLEQDASPSTQTATAMLPPTPPTPPAPPGTAMGPGARGPIAGVALGPWGALAYAALIIALNVSLGYAAQTVGVQQALRVLVVALAGAQPAARQLIAAVVSGTLTSLAYLVLLVPALVLARVRGLRPARAFGLRPFRTGQALRLSLALVVGGLVVTSGYGLVLRAFGITAPSNVVQIVQGFGTSPVAMAIGYLLVGVVAPFVEEITFRGVVFGGLRSGWGTAAGVIVSGALFGIVHLVPLEALPLALIGMGLAAILMRTRSLWPAVIAHGCYNVVVLTIAFTSVPFVR
jgi:membrane protease YdiL (CAAX protease family)